MLLQPHKVEMFKCLYGNNETCFNVIQCNKHKSSSFSLRSYDLEMEKGGQRKLTSANALTLCEKDKDDKHTM